MTTLRDRLIAEREAKGWTGAELARQCKIAQSFVGALESRGQQNSKFLPEMAHALGVDAYWLKTGKGNKRGVAFDSLYDKHIAAVIEIMESLDLEGRITVKAKVEEWAKQSAAPPKQKRA